MENAKLWAEVRPEECKKSRVSETQDCRKSRKVSSSWPSVWGGGGTSGDLALADGNYCTIQLFVLFEALIHHHIRVFCFPFFPPDSVLMYFSSINFV